MQFAEENRHKIGTFDVKNMNDLSSENERQVVYTEYGPLFMKSQNALTDSDSAFVHFEGVFKFNVENQEKLLYFRTTGRGLDTCDFVSDLVIVRGEDGVFEECNCSCENRIDIEDIKNYHKYGATQVANVIMVRDYFGKQRDLCKSTETTCD